MTRPPSPDPNALLCRDCGYVIDGLPAEANCSECGKDVAGSLPGARPGSPWQRSPTKTNWSKTFNEAFTSPIGSFERCRFDTQSNTTLLRWNLSIAALGPVLAIFVYGMFDSYAASLFGWLTVTIVAVTPAIFIWLVAMLGLFVLVEVERLGLATISRRRKLRITRPVSLAIVAHASPGWIVGGAIVTVSVFAGPAMRQFSNDHNLGLVRPVFALAPFWLPVFGFFAGMLCFETLVYVGVKKCRYANLPPDSNRSAPANPGSGAA